MVRAEARRTQRCRVCRASGLSISVEVKAQRTKPFFLHVCPLVGKSITTVNVDMA